MENDRQRVLDLLMQAKKLAKEYRAVNGRPLGITGEVAECEAMRVLGVELAPVRQSGYDATETSSGLVRRLQIKGRCLFDGAKPGQRLGSIDINKEWDAVLLVILDENLDALAIYDGQRDAILTALLVPGSKARNERGALTISKFKSISTLRWSRTMAANA
jgi:hypothetical protein